MLIINILYFLVSIILLLVTLFIMFDMIVSMLIIRVPSLSSKKAVLGKIIKDPFLKNIFLKDKILYDLGCGKGTSLIELTRGFPIQSIGYEINPAVLLYAKLRRLLLSSKVRKRLRIERGNFFKVDLSGADIIYLYLFPEIVLKLEDKIMKECKKGTYIICNTFDFQKLKPIWEYKSKKNLENIFVYKIY